jgi:hypothetical protein
MKSQIIVVNPKITLAKKFNTNFSMCICGHLQKENKATQIMPFEKQTMNSLLRSMYLIERNEERREEGEGYQ